MTARLGSARVSLEQEAVQLHDPVDPLRVRRGPAVLLGLPAKESVDAPIAVGRQISDERLDHAEQLGVGCRRTATSRRGLPGGGRLPGGGEVRAR